MAQITLVELGYRFSTRKQAFLVRYFISAIVPVQYNSAKYVMGLKPRRICNETCSIYPDVDHLNSFLNMHIWFL